MMMAFITIKKIPRVTMVIGMVRIIKIGLRKIFKKAREIATYSADKGSSTCTPGRIYAQKMMAAVVRMRFIMKPIFVYV